MINICYSTDNNYFKYMVVSLTSAVYCNKGEEVCFHILCDGVEDGKKSLLKKYEEKFGNLKIFFHDIDRKKFEKFKDVSTYPGITLPAYFRLYLPSILKDVDTVLYLDGDTVINGSLKNLFETDLSDYCIAGVPDINCSSFESTYTCFGLKENGYVNSGVVLMNLKRMREINSGDMIDAFLSEHKDEIKFGDQDILNIVFKNDILILPDVYNVHGANRFNRNTYKKPIIIHHVCKAWNFGYKTYYQGKYFKYLRKTDFAVKPYVKELFYRFRWSAVAFFRTVFHPAKIFSFEYMYGIYRWTFRKSRKLNSGRVVK